MQLAKLENRMKYYKDRLILDIKSFEILEKDISKKRIWSMNTISC